MKFAGLLKFRKHDSLEGAGHIGYGIIKNIEKRLSQTRILSGNQT